MTREEAISAILQKILQLKPLMTARSNEIQFWIEKLVVDVLAYCHRKDFPEALIYTCVDLILKRITDREAATPDEEGVVALPLSEIKMDDTSFKFDTNFSAKTATTDNVGLLSDSDFDSIKSKLNLYRRLVSW